MADPVNFTRSAADRIANAVRVVEFGNRDGSGPDIDRPWVGGGKTPVRLCKTTSAWLRNTSATLDVWESGDPLDEQPSLDANDEIKTLVAYNKSYNVAACVWVIVGKGKNGNWYLLEAATPDPSNSGECEAPNVSGHDLTTVSGYASDKKQALTHDENACLKWVDIEECPTGGG